MPSLPPPLWADLYLGSTWTSITDDVSTEAAVTVTRGRSSERDSAGPAQGNLPLINTGAKYSRRNPNSALFGDVGLNTPVRYGVTAGAPWVLCEGAGVTGSYLSTPSSTALNISGDLELRWEMSFDDPTPNQSFGARWGASGSWSWIAGLNSSSGKDGTPFLVWSPDGTTNLGFLATAPIPAMPGQRLALRIVLDVNNGAGGNTLSFYTAKSIDADEQYWQMLGAPIVTAGTTSVFNPASQDLWVGRGQTGGWNCLDGRLFRFRMYSAGTLKADLDASTATVAATSFTDSKGLTWTLNGDCSLINDQRLFHGEIPSWNPSVDKSGNERRMATTPAGIMQRLDSGNQVLRSPLYREMTNAGRSGIVAYWPCEEVSGSTVVSSGLGQNPMAISGTGTPTFGSYNGLAGSDALPDMATSTFTANVAAYTATGETSLRAWVAVPSGGVSAQANLFRLTTTGTAAVWELLLETDGDLTLNVRDGGGTSLLGTRIDFNTNGELIAVVLETTQNGSDVDWTLHVENYTGATSIHDTIPGSSASGTITSKTFGRVTRIVAASGGALTGVALGHITLASDLAAYSQTADAALGWRGEGARARFNRLCREQNVAGAAGIDTTNQPYMGAQKSGKFLDLLREVETTDGGILTERPDGLGLAYRGASTMWGQQPALVLDWTAGLIDAITPKDDTKAAFNQVTARRIDGSEYTYTLETGVNSVADIGLYNTGVDLSLYSDDALPSQAYRRVQLATVDEMRWPLLSLSLANERVYAMIDKIYAVDIGDLIRLDNIPDDYGAGYVDLIVVGIQDAEGPQDWSRGFVCVPGEPWNASVVGSVYGRADTDGSELAAALNATQTDVDVLTTGQSPWVPSGTYPDDFPFDVRVGGEVMTVTAVTGVVADSFQRILTSGWGTTDTGDTWTTTGGSASDYSVQGA